MNRGAEVAGKRHLCSYSSLLLPFLLDVNECDDLNGPAALCVHGHCENTEGSYRCHCSPGYVAEAGPPHCIAKE